MNAESLYVIARENDISNMMNEEKFRLAVAIPNRSIVHRKRSQILFLRRNRFFPREEVESISDISFFWGSITGIIIG